VIKGKLTLHWQMPINIDNHQIAVCHFSDITWTECSICNKKVLTNTSIQGKHIHPTKPKQTLCRWSASVCAV